jgi:hypothetical protein
MDAAATAFQHRVNQESLIRGLEKGIRNSCLLTCLLMGDPAKAGCKP